MTGDNAAYTVAVRGGSARARGGMNWAGLWGRIAARRCVWGRGAAREYAGEPGRSWAWEMYFAWGVRGGTSVPGVGTSPEPDGYERPD